MSAAARSDSKLVQLLLEHRADHSLTNSVSPLFLARFRAILPLEQTACQEERNEYIKIDGVPPLSPVCKVLECVFSSHHEPRPELTEAMYCNRWSAQH